MTIRATRQSCSSFCITQPSSDTTPGQLPTTLWARVTMSQRPLQKTGSLLGLHEGLHRPAEGATVEWSSQVGYDHLGVLQALCFGVHDACSATGGMPKDRQFSPFDLLGCNSERNGWPFFSRLTSHVLLPWLAYTSAPQPSPVI